MITVPDKVVEELLKAIEEALVTLELKDKKAFRVLKKAKRSLENTAKQVDDETEAN